MQEIYLYRVNKQAQYYEKCLNVSSSGVERLSFRLGLPLIMTMTSTFFSCKIHIPKEKTVKKVISTIF